MAISHSTIHDLSKDGNSANFIYSKLPAYTIQSTESINYSDTHTQVHQPQSTYNINSSLTSSNLNQNIIQSTNEISSYKTWSIINIWCCNICLGCVALRYSNKTKDLKRKDLVQDALKTSEKARIINVFATTF
ncbi:unnamed protein product [Adineta steineri]|uniref:Uncharacterized protein n=1 Tax=Adineta steineri TaxID=433720 RepID=A0A814BL06_9BILA|nr:unnamed protein product [Adineta steineri]CAF3918305.1 unnamed protein product [Adineta steineri]CAF4021889.1 unnamed protein product [Adineta steineri]